MQTGIIGSSTSIIIDALTKAYGLTLNIQQTQDLLPTYTTLLADNKS